MNKPAFPCPIFFQPLRNIVRAVQHGIDVFCGPEVENRGALSPANLEVREREWINAVGAAGAWVVLKNPRPPIPDYCYAFMLSADEPDGKGIPPEAIKAEFDRLRAIDRNMPIVLSLDGSKVTSALKPGNNLLNWDLYRRYLDLCNIATVDPYPMNRNADHYKTTWPGDAIAAIKSVDKNKKVWAWLEVNDQQLDPPPVGQGHGREPTPAEIKAQWDYAKALGADGIGWFLTQDKGKYGWPDSYWPMKNRNGHSIAPNYDMMKSLNLSVKGQTTPTPTPIPAPIPSGTPQVVLILGNYKDIAAHKALADAILKAWKPQLGNAPIFVTRYDADVAAEIRVTYPTGPLRIVGFSFGGSKAVDVCRELGTRPVEKLILIDPVPRPPNVPYGPGQFPGFEIPANVKSAWCGYRLPSEQKTLFSSPIRTGGEFTNYHYVPEPGHSEEEQHGQLIWNGVAVKQVVGK